MASSQQVTVTLTHASGAQDDVTSSAAYTVADPTIVSVAAGLVTALAVGETDVAIEAGDQATSLHVVVTDPTTALAVDPESLALELPAAAPAEGAPAAPADGSTPPAA